MLVKAPPFREIYLNYGRFSEHYTRVFVKYLCNKFRNVKYSFHLYEYHEITTATSLYV